MFILAVYAFWWSGGGTSLEVMSFIAAGQTEFFVLERTILSGMRVRVEAVILHDVVESLCLRLFWVDVEVMDCLALGECLGSHVDISEVDL